MAVNGVEYSTGIETDAKQVWAVVEPPLPRALIEDMIEFDIINEAMGDESHTRGKDHPKTYIPCGEITLGDRSIEVASQFAGHIAQYLRGR